MQKIWCCSRGVSCHLKFALSREDANPSVVVVSHHDVAVHIHGDTGRPLQLSRRATSDAKAHLELAVVGKNLQADPKPGGVRCVPLSSS